MMCVICYTTLHSKYTTHSHIIPLFNYVVLIAVTLSGHTTNTASSHTFSYYYSYYCCCYCYCYCWVQGYEREEIPTFLPILHSTVERVDYFIFVCVIIWEMNSTNAIKLGGDYYVAFLSCTLFWNDMKCRVEGETLFKLWLTTLMMF